MTSAQFTTFHQAASQQAVISKADTSWRCAVHLVDLFGFLADIHQLRHRCLHAESHLVLGNACLDLRVAEARERTLVERGEIIEHLTPDRAIEPTWIFEIEERILTATHQYPLMVRG